MKRRPTVRATRLTGPTNQIDRGGALAARRAVDYWCADDHRTVATFADDVEPPAEWPCGRCGSAATPQRGDAGRSESSPVFFRTPYEFLMMRRTVEEGERLLDEALAALRETRARSAQPRDRRR